MSAVFTHFVFVDYENVQGVDLALVEDRPVHVTLLIGKKQTKLELSLVRQIHRLAAKVDLVEVGASGPNALDLTLAFYLGRAAQLCPEAEFTIVSKDKDFDAMLAHLVGKGIRVVREDSFAAAFRPVIKKALSKPPFVIAKPVLKTAAQIKPAKAAAKFEKFIQHLRNSPPSNKTKLEHMIEAYFKPSLPSGGTKGVVAELIKRDVIAIDPTEKVTVL